MTPEEALHTAIKTVGNEADLARKLGITAQAVNQWHVAPPMRVLEIERISGVSRHDLCPTLYPRADAAA